MPGGVIAEIILNISHPQTTQLRLIGPPLVLPALSQRSALMIQECFSAAQYCYRWFSCDADVKQMAPPT